MTRSSGLTLTTLLFLFGVRALAGGAQPEPKAGAARRAGTFDSRAVAVAYYRSEAFRREIQGLKAEFEKAKAAGDEKRMKELDARGSASQDLAHKQSFGTWPIDNVLAAVKGRLPDVARDAAVGLLVSKWSVAYLDPAADTVDVTDSLVSLFAPDETTLKIVAEVRKQEPLSPEALAKQRD